MCQVGEGVVSSLTAVYTACIQRCPITQSLGSIIEEARFPPQRRGGGGLPRRNHFYRGYRYRRNLSGIHLFRRWLIHKLFHLFQNGCDNRALNTLPGRDLELMCCARDAWVTRFTVCTSQNRLVCCRLSPSLNTAVGHELAKRAHAILGYHGSVFSVRMPGVFVVLVRLR